MLESINLNKSNGLDRQDLNNTRHLGERKLDSMPLVRDRRELRVSSGIKSYKTQGLAITIPPDK